MHGFPVRNATFGVLQGRALFMGGSINERSTDTIWTAPDFLSPDQGSPQQWSRAEQRLTIPRHGALGLYHASGVLLAGGMHAQARTEVVERISWQDQSVVVERLADLPDHLHLWHAVIVGDQLIAALQTRQATIDLFALALDTEAAGNWRSLSKVPLDNVENLHQVLLVFNSTTNQLLITIEREVDTHPHPVELWSFNFATKHWQALSATIAVNPINFAVGQGTSYLFLASDSNLHAYNVVTDTWFTTRMESPLTSAASVLATTTPTPMLAAVDTHQTSLWCLEAQTTNTYFGGVNTAVLVIYLLGVVLVGVYFTFRNTDTNQYFRGGQSIPWWAAACSIYATMASSLSFVAFPALIYRTDWRIFISALTIFIVTPVVVYIVMPFFRQIDATSAYEYLSKRFSLGVRLCASGLFTLFHLSRMGIVMSLTALALAAVTPFDAAQCVLLMGVLCLLYCTLGGIEGVIWTDTLQAVVLLVGGTICLVFLVAGIDGGLGGFIEIGMADDKFTLVDLDFGPTSALTLSLWVVVLGGIGQSMASYTADQAIVQRYMVTKDQQAAARSLWFNAALALPGGLLFYLIGTALYAFYKTNPERLDPTIQTDQILPFFVANELPVGVAGLIIAAIFAAAQSTVSTSMNSMASTLVTDFLRPFNICASERGYLRAARGFTLLTGILGTGAGLLFIDPSILSLMEEYFKVIGMFMGALGGLFILGMVSKRANAFSAMAGLAAGVLVMILVWHYNWANGFIFAPIGILVCLIVGLVVSLVLPPTQKPMQGLTLHSMRSGCVT